MYRFFKTAIFEPGSFLNLNKFCIRIYIIHLTQKLQQKNNSVLRSQSYLFSAPTPAPLSSLISAPAPAPAPAPAMYCNLKLFYNSNTILMEVYITFFFILASSKLTAGNIHLKNNFGSGSGSGFRS